MKRIKNKFLGFVLVTSMTFTSMSSLLINDVNIVHAAESKALTNAKAKVTHLTKSLKTNYLGIKNQAMWQTYIKQARDLIKKIPNSEKTKRDSLTIEVNKGESLVNGLARINQVEKSIQPKSQGGYGNFLGIKNAETWNGYLKLAKADLEKVDKNIFKNQYNELISRMNKVSKVVTDIEDKFKVEYDKVVNLYQEARLSNDIEKGYNALEEAQKLGTCDRSDKLERDIIEFINDNSDNDNKMVNFQDKNLEKLIRAEIGKLSGAIYQSDVQGITELYAQGNSIKNISGIENLINLQELDLLWNSISDISPLKNLTNLRKLWLGGNEIKDIRPLGNLINLQELYLEDNEIIDRSPLEKLINLQELYIDPITENQAVKIIRDIIPNKGYLISIREDEVINGIEYYLINVNEDIIHDGEYSHSVTYGWFYVNKNSGAAYKWNLADDTYERVN